MRIEGEAANDQDIETDAGDGFLGGRGAVGDAAELELGSDADAVFAVAPAQVDDEGARRELGGGREEDAVACAAARRRTIGNGPSGRC